MTLRELTAILARHNIPDARFEAGVLARHFCGTDFADPDCAIPAAAEPALRAALARRTAGEPLQYIIGEWDFFRETYTVTPDCLIPRPDTELLVELAIEMLPPGARFADFCTGSGCVAISTLAARPDTRAVAVDVSAAALAVAGQNARRNGVAERIEFVEADIFGGHLEVGKLDAVLANPPYIPTAVLPTLGRELAHEPAIALDGGGDGLRFYRRIIADYRAYLGGGGFMLLEIGYDQAVAVASIAADAGLDCEIRRDLGGNDRVAVVRAAAK